MHECDVRNCVNVDHLRVGTQAENIADKVRKNRQARGTNQAAARLTDEAVRLIRATYRRQSRPGATDGNAKELAAQFGVTPHVVYNVIKGKSWAHVA
jgi:hypothetical protein